MDEGTTKRRSEKHISPQHEYIALSTKCGPHYFPLTHSIYYYYYLKWPTIISSVKTSPYVWMKS
jgi:hypothetical protein